MINVRELMTDPDFSTHYTVVRTKGRWEKGRFIASPPTKLKYYGPVQPASEKELQQIPEGDRQREIVKFMCAPPKKIYVTHKVSDDSEADGVLSDQVIYDGELYKIIQSKNWRRNGFTRAFGYSIGEASADG